MSFHLNFMLLMINCDRTEEATRSLAQLNEETTNA
jgi:hypothetical protein